jgi:hypothetical protein
LCAPLYDVTRLMCFVESSVAVVVWRCCQHSTQHVCAQPGRSSGGGHAQVSFEQQGMCDVRCWFFILILDRSFLLRFASVSLTLSRPRHREASLRWRRISTRVPSRWPTCLPNGKMPPMPLVPRSSPSPPPSLVSTLNPRRQCRVDAGLARIAWQAAVTPCFTRYDTPCGRPSVCTSGGVSALGKRTHSASRAAVVVVVGRAV